MDGYSIKPISTTDIKLGIEVRDKHGALYQVVHICTMLVLKHLSGKTKFVADRDGLIRVPIMGEGMFYEVIRNEKTDKKVHELSQ